MYYTLSEFCQVSGWRSREYGLQPVRGVILQINPDIESENIKSLRVDIVGVDSGVDTQLGDGMRQHGGGGGRVSQIVSRDVDGLDGSD